MLRQLQNLFSNRESNSIQALWIALGSFIAFSFSIISAAILSRYLTKDDYGTYRQVLYVYTTLLVVFSVGLPKAYSHFLPVVSINEAKQITRKITNVFFVLGLFMSVTLYAGAPLIASVLNNPDLEIGIRYFSPTPFLMLPTMGIEGIYATYKNTLVIAVYTIFTRVLMLAFVALPVIYISNDVLVAVKGFVVASFFSFLIALYLKNKPFRFIESIESSISYKELIRFSLPLMYASIAGMLILAADQFYISRYFGREVFAEFSNGSLQLPFVAMITGAVATVLQPHYSRMKNEGRIESDFLPVWRNAIEKSSILIYPLVLFFWFYSDIIMVFIYGELYVNSSYYFKIMSLVNFFSVVSYLPLVLAMSLTAIYSRIHWLAAILIWITDFFVVTYFANPYLITVISVVCKLFVIFSMINLVSRKMNTEFRNLLPTRVLGKVFLSCSLVLILLSFSTDFLVSHFSYLFVISFSFFAYIIGVLLTGYIVNINYLTVLKPLLLKKK